MANRYKSTWNRIYELGRDGDEIDAAYAELLTAALHYRIDNEITQVELAKKSGLTSGTISKIESQQNVPHVKNFLKYIRGLGLDWTFNALEQDP